MPTRTYLTEESPIGEFDVCVTGSLETLRKIGLEVDREEVANDLLYAFATGRGIDMEEAYNLFLDNATE